MSCRGKFRFAKPNNANIAKAASGVSKMILIKRTTMLLLYY